MELLYELESQADEFVVERLRRTIADALSQYKPMCEECDVAMARHHSYERTLITKYGEMRLDVPVYRCGDCGAMTSGMDVIGKGRARKRYSKKMRDEAMRLAAQGISCERVGKMLGFAKSTLCKWLKQEQYKRPKLSGEVLELDGVWTRVAGGKLELKVARDERGVALASAGSWEDAVAAARDLGADAPRHIVSDGDRAIESAIDMAYGRGTPHQLCQFHLLREYTRNIGIAGFAEAKALLGSDDIEQARGHAGRIVALTRGKALRWRVKALRKGLTHLRTGESSYRTTSLLERFNREIRARERMGTVWTVHNLLVLLQLRGVLA